jgi:hypothetical protein
MEAPAFLQKQPLVWHYTTVDCFKRIVRDGVLRPATAAVPQHERPVVWFSTNEYWEQSANKALQMSDGRLIALDMKGTAKHGGGLIRIGVAPERAPHTWNEMRRVARIDRRMARALMHVARRDGADPQQWRGSLEPVSRADWVAVEVFVSGAWVPVNLADAEPSSN